MSLKPGEGKHISVRPNSNAPNAYFICFHLQLAFHDLFRIAKLKSERGNINFCKKSCSTCMDTPIIEFV